LDTQLKQRLTGAVILVALAVLLVPEILSGPPERRVRTESASTQALEQATSSAPGPMEAGEMRSVTIDLQSDGVQPMSAAADLGESAESPTMAAGADRAANVGAESTDGSTSDEQSSDERASNRSPGDAAPPVAARAPRPDSDSGTGATTRVTATPSARAGDEVPRTGFSVQVGSFGSRDNATRLVRQLQDKGFPAYIAAPNSGSTPGLARVRVGPVNDRAAAQELAARLQRAGQKSTAVVPNS
jgi:DedD protein